MNTNQWTGTSIWLSGTAGMSRTPLLADTGSDACVIGAGIAGLMCAYGLAGAGLHVVVLEAGEIGCGQTCLTSAHLSCAIDDRFFEIERMHGPEAARLCAESHAAGISWIERIAEEEGIECDFARVDGHLFVPPGESTELLDREMASAHRAGLDDVERSLTTPSLNVGASIRFPRQAQFDPMKFLGGLAAAVERRGGVIHTGSRVTKISGHAPFEVQTGAGHRVRANAVVMATNSPVHASIGIHTKQAAHRTYIIVSEIPERSVPRGLYWDTSEKAGDTSGPYHYVRVASSLSRADADDRLIVGGRDHRTGEEAPTSEPWDELEAWARVRWPVMGRVLHRWSGQVQEPHDAVAFIGQVAGAPKGLYVVTGDSGMGLTHASIAGMLIPDLVSGTANRWASLYDPARRPTSASAEFAHHAATMASHYADWLTPGSGVDSISAGQGKVVRRGLELLAVHRDKDGNLHTRSAACPHLGCVVQWNRHAQSWDCPCHGSRFGVDGRVLIAPAVSDLKAKST